MPCLNAAQAYCILLDRHLNNNVISVTAGKLVDTRVFRKARTG